MSSLFYNGKKRIAQFIDPSLKLVLLFSCLVNISTSLCLAQSSNFFNNSSTAPTPPINMPSTPVQIPVETPRIPIINIPRDIPRDIPTTIMPTDVTNPFFAEKMDSVSESPRVLQGIKALADNKFSQLIEETNAEGMRIQYKQGSLFEKTANTSVRLDKGTILVSLRRPSKLANISTNIAECIFNSDADVFFNFDNDVLRIANLTGMKDSVRIQLKESIFASSDLKNRTFSIKPGYEMLISLRKLKRADFRPHDGYARRSFATLAEGHIGICEFSLQSLVGQSDLIAQLSQNQSDNLNKRILSDMSKMAAVLNYLNGSQGYISELAKPSVKKEVSGSIQ